MPFIKPFNRLYHYRSFDTVVKNILPDKKLRLGPLLNTNDPRENKSFIFAAASRVEIDIGNIDDRNKEISHALREDCKVLCFSDDTQNYHGYEMSRMWAHYGGNHKGVCLELDKGAFVDENATIVHPHLFKKIIYYQHQIKTPIQHRWVDYVAMQNHGKEKYIKEIFRPSHLDYLYFTKNREWESEEEIRLIHFSNNKADEFCSIKNSLKNIYLGLDFDDKNIQTLIDLCPTADIYKLEYHEVRMAPRLFYEGSKK